MKWLLCLGILWSGAMFMAQPSYAEPWLGNRFAQNCAGCHAPGRKNLPPVKRRCTLACQGCHVSPQGTGMRSHYGKWTEDRWLKSFRTDLLGHKNSFAPYSKQPYATQGPDEEAEDPGKGERGKARRAKKKREPEKEPNFKGLFVKRGALLAEVPQTEMDESLFDVRDRMHFVEAKSRAEFEYQIPFADPYREMLYTKIDGGVDLRWQLQSANVKRSTELGESDTDLWHSFLMSTDLSLRWRPIHKMVHVVYEGRYFGQPADKKLPEKVGAQFVKRNFFVLVDDLPYATYVMGGYYRPIFGNPHPDHTILSQRMISYALQDSPSGYNLNYQAYSFGGSPNVPYANVHIIGRQYGAAPNETTKGFAFNGGGRFVTLGLSINYSYWRTTREVMANGKEVESQIEMNHIGLGGQFGPTTVTIDGISFNKDVPNSGFYSGGVWSLETHTRFWRENYAVVGYHLANVAETLVPGGGTQMRLGVRSFVTPGVEVQVGLRRESQETEKVDDRTSESGATLQSWVAQIHLYM